MTPIRYSAAACQTDLPNPIDRAAMARNTDRMLAMIDAAVSGAAPFLPVRLIVFPEFAHSAPVFATPRELLDALAVPVPNEHTERLASAAREYDVFIQSGTMLEADPRWPGVVFNTTCLIGPDGVLSKYRKVNPWIPYEVHASPHDLAGYDEPLFPVVDTPIGRLGCAICYDWLFPEAIRQLAANGAEVLIRVSAYMDPWGATEPMDWWTIVNRCRALENIAYVVAANQGAIAPSLSAVLVAGRQPGGGLRWPHPRRRRRPARASESSSRRSTSPRSARARGPQRPSHAGAPANRGLPGLPGASLSSRTRGAPRAVVRAQPRPDRGRQTAQRVRLRPFVTAASR